MLASKTYSTDWVCHQRRANARDRIISCLEFDEGGNYLAMGDIGGNVTLLKRNPVRAQLLVHVSDGSDAHWHCRRAWAPGQTSRSILC